MRENPVRAGLAQCQICFQKDRKFVLTRLQIQAHLTLKLGTSIKIKSDIFRFYILKISYVYKQAGVIKSS